MLYISLKKRTLLLGPGAGGPGGGSSGGKGPCPTCPYQNEPGHNPEMCFGCEGGGSSRCGTCEDAASKNGIGGWGASGQKYYCPIHGKFN